MPESKLTRRNVLKATGAVTAASAVSLGSDQTNEAAENKNTAPDAPSSVQLSPAQQKLEQLWEEHLASEFKDKSALSAVNTMVAHPNVNHIPVMTGGVNREQLQHFYGTYFIPQMPEDTAIVPISRTIGNDRIVDEFVFKFTHSVQMDWLLPGVAPTNKPVEVVKVVIVQFEDGKIKSERIHWDQASVLVQIGLIEPEELPVAGVATARKALNPELPSNELMKRTIDDPQL